MPKADFSKSKAAVTVNLPAGIATAFTGKDGTISTEAPMLRGENGFTVHSLLTTGETLQETNGVFNPSTAASYTPVGRFDGIGAFKSDSGTVRVLVNHEIGSAAGYTISDGGSGRVSLDGARISYFDIDTKTMAIVDGGLAYDVIHNRDGQVVSGAGQLEIPGGLRSFCSGGLFEANGFGAGHGLADRIYFAGEEASGPHGGTEWALDTATGDLWAVPAFGRARFENVAELDTGDASHVAFLLSDDSSGAALLLYVGTKHAGGNFLDRNGLKDGQLYVWKADDGALSPSQFTAGTKAGSWVPIDARDISKAGQAGYDAAGYADASTLTAKADGLGGFSFRRPEDVSVNPAEGTEAVFATTGTNASSNRAGTIYTVSVDFTQIANPTASITVLYNANLDAGQRIRNPDNLDWADDGRIYVQEDRAATGLFGDGAANGHDASILRIDPTTGAILRVAEMDRSAIAFGATDGAAGEIGTWESSGILDVSSLFGKAPGTLFLADVQAHSIVDPNLASRDLDQAGQLVAITAPGAGFGPVVSRTDVDGVTRVIGSKFDDTIIGDGAANRLIGRAGNDRIDGGDGRDVLLGGSGRDLLVDSGDGHDRIGGGRGGDEIAGGLGRDVMAGGKGHDVFVFHAIEDSGAARGDRDRIKDFRHGVDLIDLSAIDANGAAAGDAAFSFLSGKNASFSGAGAELRWYLVNRKGDAHDKTVVAADTDGDRKADFKIELTGLVHLTGSDFVL